MTTSYMIENIRSDELEFIFKLVDDAIRYQQEKRFPVWKDFDKNVLMADVKNNNLYKVTLESQIVMAFSVCYTDKVIWREKEKGDAIYLHRIVVNPSFKGQRLLALIVDWAIEHAKQRRLNFIRMDTWAENVSLVNYYKGFGFSFVENFTTPDSPELPSQNRNLLLALLEIKL